jgi:hypothetical protein
MEINLENLKLIAEKDSEFENLHKKFLEDNKELIDTVNNFTENLQKVITEKYDYLVEKYGREDLYAEPNYQEKNLYVTLWGDRNSCYNVGTTHETYVIPFDKIPELLKMEKEEIENYRLLKLRRN